MSTQLWSDAPSGAYEDHIVDDVFRQASFNTVLFRYATLKKVDSGQSLTVPSIDILDSPTSAALNEDEYIPLDKLTVTSKAIYPEERGRGVKLSNQVIRRSPIDILGEHRRRIEDQMTRDLDLVVKRAMDDTLVDYVANSATGQAITTTGTPVASATDNPNFYHMRFLAGYMRDDLRIPPLADGSLVAIFRLNGVQSLRDDTEFTEFHRGDAAEMKQYGVGSIEGFKVVSTNHSDALSNDLAGAGVSEGLLFGAEACYFAFLDRPSIHFDFREDYGRFKGIAWYGDYAAGLSSDSANAGLVRCVHWTSA